MVSLNRLIRVQRLLVRIRIAIYNRFWGMSIDKTAVISLKAHIDKTYPKGVFIGANTYVALGATILSHDMVRGLRTNTVIGSNCFVGARSIVLPGVRVGDGCIVAAGAVVTKNVPDNCIVAGNPAKVVSEDISVKEFGVLVR